MAHGVLALFVAVGGTHTRKRNDLVAVERLQDSKQGEFDLVLMDIQMPKMDGYAATRQIRTLPSDVANVPIVAMTANAFEEDKQKAIRAGMNAHIAKPIEAGRLMETLSHILT